MIFSDPYLSHAGTKEGQCVEKIGKNGGLFSIE
jgi:hypothetical protein